MIPWHVGTCETSRGNLDTRSYYFSVSVLSLQRNYSCHGERESGNRRRVFSIDIDRNRKQCRSGNGCVTTALLSAVVSLTSRGQTSVSLERRDSAIAISLVKCNGGESDQNPATSLLPLSLPFPL